MVVKSWLRAGVCVLLMAGALAPAATAEEGKFDAAQAKALVEARHALEQGELRRAVEMFGALINSRKLPPQLLAHALLNRGLAHQRLGDMQAAITDYDAALRIDALDTAARVRALYNRALAWRAQGKPEQAIEDLTAALYLDPQFALAWHARGNILHERGLYYLALSDYEQALKHDHPRPHRVHYARALLFSALNSLNRTKEALQAALQAKPDFEPARKRLAAILTGRVKANRLFADLLQPPARKKRIYARIHGEGSGQQVQTTGVRVASIHVPAPGELNLRKTPQKTAEAPPVPGQMVVAAATEEEVRGHVPVPRPRPAVPQAEPVKQAAAKPVMEPRQAGKPQVRTATITPVSAEATEEVEVALEEDKPRWRGWAVQIASQRSEEAARAHWQKLEHKVRRRIGRAELAIMKADLGARGIFYRLRLVGFGDRKTAKRACRALKRARISCIVVQAES